MTGRRLAHQRVAAPGVEPGRWLYMVHGAYGAGRNWGSVARRLVESLPAWGVVLVDLREHGGSRGFEPPHTLEAAAADLRVLAEGIGLPMRGLLGHSLGGKVALEYVRNHAGGLEQLWLVDSTPEARPPGGSAWQMLHILRRLPGPFPSRAAGIESLQREGVDGLVAAWMATNLEPEGDEYRWRIDLDAIESLLRDFFRTDLWDVIEHPPSHVELHVVKAEDSSVLSEAAWTRLLEAGRRSGRVFVHSVAGGHWVNSQNPQALLDLLTRHLPGGS